MFHVTNTACVINLDNTELSFGSGVFLEIAGQNQWGTTGSNGGVAELNTDNEKIEGNDFSKSFVEFWKFVKKDDRWVLAKILQRDEASLIKFQDS